MEYGFHLLKNKEQSTSLFRPIRDEENTSPRRCLNTKLLIQTTAMEFTSVCELAAVVRAEMIRLAKQLPEYSTVTAMHGIDDVAGAQLMAEIGDVRNYPRRNSIVAFAGIDPEVDKSGKKPV